VEKQQQGRRRQPGRGQASDESVDKEKEEEEEESESGSEIEIETSSSNSSSYSSGGWDFEECGAFDEKNDGKDDDPNARGGDGGSGGAGGLWGKSSGGRAEEAYRAAVERYTKAMQGAMGDASYTVMH
jgi:hypothetical protein